MLKGRPMLCMGVAAMITVAVALFTYSNLLWGVVTVAVVFLFIAAFQEIPECRWLAVGVLCGLLSVSFLVMHQKKAQLLVNQQFHFLGEVYQTEHRQLIQVQLDSGKSWLVRPTRELEGMETGDRLAGTLTVQNIQYDKNTYLLSQGILLDAQIEKVELAEHSFHNFAIWTQKVRNRITERAMLKNGSEDTATTLALCYSETSYLSKERLLAFRKCGISHLLSVSGLHLTMLVVCMMTIGETLGMSKTARTLLGIAVSIIIFFAAGMSAGAFRSAIMMCMLLIGQCVNRTSDSLNTLGFVAVIAMAFWPTMIGNLSFIFTMGVTAGILLWTPVFSEHIYLFLISHMGEKKRKIIWIFSKIIAVNVAAQFSALPLTAIFFGNLPLLGGVIGLLLVPLMYPLLLLGFAIGVFFAMGLDQIGKCLLTLANCLSGFMGKIAENFEKIPLSNLPMQYLADYVVLFMIIAVVLVLAYCHIRWSKKKIVTILCSGFILLIILVDVVLLPSVSVGICSDTRNGVTVIDSQNGAIILDKGLTDSDIKYRKNKITVKPQKILCLTVTSPLASEKMIKNVAEYWGVPLERVITSQNEDHVVEDVNLAVICDSITLVHANGKKIVKYWGNYATIDEVLNSQADVIIDRDGHIMNRRSKIPVLRRLDGRSSVRIYGK